MWTPTIKQIEEHQATCATCQRALKLLHATYTNNALVRQHVDEAVFGELLVTLPQV